MSINTNWYIITGAPGSGKTALIKHLASLGYTIIPEAARNLIDVEIKKGKTIKEIRSDEGEFQKKVFRIKVKTENKISPQHITFIDGGAIPSSIAYYQISGLDPAPVIEETKKRKYKGVFFLEQLPFKKDYARVENKKTANDLNQLLYKTYLDLGYDAIRIPPTSIKERVRFILKKIKSDSES